MVFKKVGPNAARHLALAHITAPHGLRACARARVAPARERIHPARPSRVPEPRPHRLWGRAVGRAVGACALVRTDSQNCLVVVTEPWMFWVGWAQVLFDSESKFQRVQVRKLAGCTGVFVCARDGREVASPVSMYQSVSCEWERAVHVCAGLSTSGRASVAAGRHRHASASPSPRVPRLYRLISL